MPTYTVTTSNVNLNSKKQKELAKGITKVHNVVTGANTYFAQVIFNNTKKKNHFMGGKIVKEPSIFLLGQIRAGRPKKTKDKLISDLKNIIGLTYDPIVSSDVVRSTLSGLVDGLATMGINNKKIKLIIWFDNGWGYAARIVDTVKKLVQVL